MNSLGHDALGSLADSALCDLHDGGSGRLKAIRSSAPADNTADDKSRHQQADRGASATAGAGDARLARGKRKEESRWRGGVPAARLSSSRVDWLAQPTCQIWHKIVSAALHELFQLCFSRCACPQ